MKRNLIQNIKAMPLGEEAIDREGFLSAVVAAKAGAEGELTVTVKDCDTAEGSFEEVKDPMLIIDGKASVSEVKTNDIVNFDIDLLGCKRYIKVEIGGAAKGEGAAVIVLGDPAKAPVEAVETLGE